MSDMDKKPSVDEILKELKQKREKQMAETAGTRNTEPKHTPENGTDVSLPKIEKTLQDYKPFSAEHKSVSDVADNKASRNFIDSYFSGSKKSDDYLKNFYREALESEREKDKFDNLEIENKEKTAQSEPTNEENGAVSEHLEAASPASDHTADEAKDLKMQRLAKIKDFVLVNDKEEAREKTPPEDEERADESQDSQEITEYRSEEDAESVRADITANYSRLIMRVILLIAPALLSLYMTFAPVLSIPLPSVLNPLAQQTPVIYAFVNLVIVVFAAFVSMSTMTEGLFSFFKLKADGDSYAALAAIAAIVHNALCFMNLSAVSTGQIHLFSSVAVLGLLCNTLGKLAMIKRVRRNFNFISAPDEKYGNILLSDDELTNAVKERTGYAVSSVCMQKKADFVSRFLEHSYSADPSDRWSRALCTLFFVGAAAVGGVVYYLTNSGLVALTSFTAILCIASPLTAMLVSNLPLLSEVKRLYRWGATIPGYSAVSEIEKTDSVVLRDIDLIPEGSVTIHGIKTFGSRPIDQTIIYTITAMHKLQNSLSDVFMQIIENNNALLKGVESISFSDEGGIEAWIASHRVHIGSREQFSVHSIDVPSKDYEEKYCKKGRQAFYVAVNDEICAMIVVSYKPRKDISMAVKRLAKLGITIFVSTTDPNLKTDMLTEMLGLKSGQIDILPSDLREAIGQVDSEPDSRIVHKGSFESLAVAITRAIRLKWNIDVGTVIQTIGSVAGFVLASVLSILSGVGQLDAMTVLLYQFSWLILITAIQKII